ncbi:MAG TPA: hypothetical protein VEI49_07350 [Terriglobales bacterium]|nr:hypothetical protein [Terriglobales bacterium]
MIRISAGLLCVVFLALTVSAAAQGDNSQTDHPTPQERVRTSLQQIRRLPAEWFIGPYIPSSRELLPLTNEQRADVYFHQTFLTAGTYVLRGFTAGIDQARGVPSQWGGGIDGYGRRFASRYGQFIIGNTLHSVGNAALGYESRYDLCRCTGLWPRTRHAIMRNFMTYNRTEHELRFAAPLYAGSFSAGMISSVWFPRTHDVWRDGAYAALQQAAWGSASNWVSEFAIDILRKVTGHKYSQNLLPSASCRP